MSDPHISIPGQPPLFRPGRRIGQGVPVNGPPLALLGAEIAELTRRELFVMAPEPGQLGRFLPWGAITHLMNVKRDVRILFGPDGATRHRKA